MINFGYIATPNSITFTDTKGKTFTLSSSDENFGPALELLKQITNTEDKLPLIEKLENVVAPSKKIIESSEHVKIENGVVFYKNKPINNTITERIIWGIKEGFNMTPYINFLENLMGNPSFRSVNQLYNFIEKHKMGITDDGYILGYKRIKNDFCDIYTGTIDNSPGQYITMERNLVSDDSDLTCHYGLHFCAFTYLKFYGNNTGNRIVIVKVNPRDIVSVPRGHAAAKVRCCAYLVLSEYLGNTDMLSEKPVFDTSSLADQPDDSSESSEWVDSEDDFGWSDSERSLKSFDTEDAVKPAIVTEDSKIQPEDTSNADNLQTMPLMPNRRPINKVDIFNVGEAPTNIENLLKGFKSVPKST